MHRLERQSLAGQAHKRLAIYFALLLEQGSHSVPIRRSGPAAAWRNSPGAPWYACPHVLYVQPAARFADRIASKHRIIAELHSWSLLDLFFWTSVLTCFLRITFGCRLASRMTWIMIIHPPSTCSPLFWWCLSFSICRLFVSASHWRIHRNIRQPFSLFEHFSGHISRAWLGWPAAGRTPNQPANLNRPISSRSSVACLPLDALLHSSLPWK